MHALATFFFFQVSISLIITEFTAGYVGNHKATAETSDSEGWLRIGLGFLLIIFIVDSADHFFFLDFESSLITTNKK